MASASPLLISISGIRGIVGESLTAEVAASFAAAFGTWLGAGRKVVLARDPRPSGQALGQACAAALQQMGCRVLDLDLCSTPGAKLMVTELGAAGAIILTASHNPLPWNGLKLIRSDGIFLNAAQGKQVEALFHSQAFSPAAGGSLEQVDPDLVQRRHLERILNAVEVGRIRRARLRVAVDPCNGAGGLLLPQLLQALEVEVHFIHGEAHGRFAHEPEPVPANLVELGQVVRQSQSTIGFAIDPDADRVALVGEDGQPVGEDYTLALAVLAVGARRQGPVVTTLSTSQLVSDAALARQCPVVLTPVGEVNVVEKMIEVGAVVGGEGNGGVILTEVDPGRDAALGVAIVLESLARQPLAAWLTLLPRYSIDKRKVVCTPAQLAGALDQLRCQHPSAYAHPVVDGVKLYLSGRLECPWIHLRASNTEPIVRIIAESTTPAEAAALCDEAEELLKG
ncbi:MAG: phosphoglucosamine mutase [Candidatus Handelsmanbacteria bacterium]|nr:phosphoglucosamine mutase [Candidatus Handelsmanbacteria bacterium]